MLNQLVSFFAPLNILGIGLAIIFGATWIALYRPPLLKKPWLWAALVVSGMLTLISAAFIQTPLQAWYRQVILHFWSPATLRDWLPLSGIPLVVLSGLIQEGAKLIPVVVYWWQKDRAINPKMGLVVGAAVGAGFGIFEAQWTNSSIFFSPGWEAMRTAGIREIVAFFDTFLIVGYHTASCALAGWGLARGWGWQFFLLASFLHALLEYRTVLLDVHEISHHISYVQGVIFTIPLVFLVIAVTLWLRKRGPIELPET